MVGAATVAVGLKMAHTPARLREQYTWRHANPMYSFGIDEERPWDIVVFDEEASDFVTIDELRERGELVNGEANEYQDAIDMAYLAGATIAIRQAWLGMKFSGVKAEFDGHMEEIQDALATPHIITTEEGFRAAAAASS